MNGTDWLPGLVVLGVALLAAAFYVTQTLARAKAARAGAATEAEKRAAELEAQYRSAIDQLRELKAERHHLSEEAYEAQRAELEKRAAGALRARDAGGSAAGASASTSAAPSKGGPAPAAQAGFFGRHPEWKGALWGGGVVAFFGILGILLFSEARPGDSGGRGPMQAQGTEGGPGGEQEHQRELEEGLKHVRAHPEDVTAAAEVAHELIHHQEWVEAFQVTERALGVDPFHLEHRIHRAALKSLRGDPSGKDDLQRLADTYPDAEEALLFLASTEMQQGDKARALDNLERYVTVAPPEMQSAEIYQAMAELRQELGRQPAP